MDRSGGGSGVLSSLDCPSGHCPKVPQLSPPAIYVSPLDTQILERGAGQGPNPAVRDTGMVTGHLPEATQSQESCASPSPDQGKDAENLKTSLWSIHTPFQV